MPNVVMMSSSVMLLNVGIPNVVAPSPSSLLMLKLKKKHCLRNQLLHRSFQIFVFRVRKGFLKNSGDLGSDGARAHSQ
jgi:hypothetical protein